MARNVWPIALLLLCLVPFFTALIVSLVTSYLVSRRPAQGQAGASTTALEILKTRYAQGELTHDQYEEMRRAMQ